MIYSSFLLQKTEMGANTTSRVPKPLTSGAKTADLGCQNCSLGAKTWLQRRAGATT